MEEIFLDVESRSGLGSGKVRHLRHKGFVPAVVYGQGNDSEAIKISHRQLMQLLHQHGLGNIVINLRLKDDKRHKPRPCVIKEIQYDPVKSDIIHVDFNEISLTKVIKVSVPVVSKGEPIGVKQEGGSVEHILWEVEVECLPTQMPKEIEVDVNNLKIGDSIFIKDIVFPSNVRVLNDPQAVVLSVAAPIKEEVSAVPVEGEEEKLEPEVIKEKKEVPAEGAEEGKEKKERDENKEKK